MRDPQARLESAAKELCAAMDYAERQGMSVRVDLNWKPGITPWFTLSHCHFAELWINGVRVECMP